MTNFHADDRSAADSVVIAADDLNEFHDAQNDGAMVSLLDDFDAVDLSTPQIEVTVDTCPDCNEEYESGEGCGCNPAFEDDGQPTEYEEWQDVYGGDDWDHGQYDCYGEY